MGESTRLPQAELTGACLQDGRIPEEIEMHSVSVGKALCTLEEIPSWSFVDHHLRLDTDGDGFADWT